MLIRAPPTLIFDGTGGQQHGRRPERGARFKLLVAYGLLDPDGAHNRLFTVRSLRSLSPNAFGTS